MLQKSASVIIVGVEAVEHRLRHMAWHDQTPIITADPCRMLMGPEVKLNANGWVNLI